MLTHFLALDSRQRVKNIQIKEEDKGFSYARVFGPCLDNNITDVTVQDSYIKAKQQVHMFLIINVRMDFTFWLTLESIKKMLLFC